MQHFLHIFLYTYMFLDNENYDKKMRIGGRAPPCLIMQAFFTCSLIIIDIFFLPQGVTLCFSSLYLPWRSKPLFYRKTEISRSEFRFFKIP